MHTTVLVVEIFVRWIRGVACFFHEAGDLAQHIGREIQVVSSSSAAHCQDVSTVPHVLPSAARPPTGMACFVTTTALKRERADAVSALPGKLTHLPACPISAHHIYLCGCARVAVRYAAVAASTSRVFADGVCCLTSVCRQCVLPDKCAAFRVCATTNHAAALMIEGAKPRRDRSVRRRAADYTRLDQNSRVPCHRCMASY